MRLPIPYMRLLFYNDPATTEIYTLSLHDALPISRTISRARLSRALGRADAAYEALGLGFLHCRGSRSAQTLELGDRKSTRLNSSHVEISYAVFCLKKKNNKYCSRCTWHLLLFVY